MTPALFLRACVTALFVTAFGMVAYVVVHLILGGPMFGPKVWLELLPILLIAGFLKGLFDEHRVAK